MTPAFRLFISSTFSDQVAERNALQERVFPALRQFCQERGARFQAVDLRWGVRDEVGLDQRTMMICLEELHRCQQTVLRPNFLILLGDRYGWRPLPQRIAAGEFKELLEALQQNERDLLLRWYRRDDNAVPAEYALRPRRGAYVDSTRWTDEETALRTCFLQAIDRLRWPAHDARRHKYEDSATHQEIRKGALLVADAAAHVFCYQRDLAALPSLADPQARTYADYLPDGRPDDDARRRLKQLKAELATRLPTDHVYHYRATWGAWPEEAALDAFCARVAGDLRGVIEAELGRLKGRSDMQHEAEAHAAFAGERSRHFLGRDRERQRIRSYLADSATAPLAIHGRVGSGKTALLAQASGEAAAPGRVVLARFLGTTPATSELRSLLEGLCREIAATYGDFQPVPADLRELLDDLPRRLALATAERPLVLFLDALDQLAAADNAHALAWLPRELPAHVKLVVSVLDEPGPAGACLEAARRLLPASQLIPLEGLSDQEGERLLATWLHEAGRTIQPQQRRTLLAGFAGCRLPLYLKLLAEEAKRWRSDEDPPLPGAGTAALLKGLFDRLELPAQHGPLLVRRSLGFLAAARHGLTEDELLDMLSADSAYFNEFLRQAHHDLPAGQRRVPPVVWSRLYHDLRPYLTERRADGTALLSFYHRQVGEAVAARYLAGEEGLHAHCSLADYFADQPLRFGALPNLRKLSEQPFQQTRGQMWEKLEATLSDLTFLEAKGAAREGLYDLQADYAAALEVLPDAREEKAQACWFDHQVARFTEELVAYARAWTAFRREPPPALAHQGPGAGRKECSRPDPPSVPSIRPWDEEEIRASAARLTRDPTLAERVRAFADFVAVESGHFQESASRPGVWLQQAYNHAAAGPVAQAAERAVAAGAEHPMLLRAFRPPYNPYPDLLRIFRPHAGEASICVTPDGRTAVAAGGPLLSEREEDYAVRVWDLVTGAPVRLLKGHTRSVKAVAITPDGKTAVSGSTDETLRVWDLTTGICRLVLQTEDTAGIESVSVTPDGSLAVSAGFGLVLSVWDLTQGRRLRTLAGQEEGPNCVSLLPDGRTALSAHGGRLCEWDLATGACVRTLEGHGFFSITDVAVTPDGRTAVTSGTDETLHVWDLASGHCLRVLQGHTAAVSCVSVTPDGRLAVSGSEDGTVRVWDLPAGRCLRLWETRDLRPGVHRVSITPDGRRVVSGQRMGTLCVWDVTRGHQPAPVDPPPLGEVIGADLSLDGRCAVSLVYNRGADKPADWVAEIWDTVSGRRVRPVGPGQDLFHFLPDGENALVLLPAGEGEGLDPPRRQLVVQNVRSGQLVCPLPGDAPDSGTLTPDGRVSVGPDADGQRLCLLDLPTGQTLRVVDVAATGSRRVLCLTPDGRAAVTWAQEEDLRVWDLLAGRCVRVLAGPPETCDPYVALSPDGRVVVARGSNDEPVPVWNPATGKCLRHLDSRTWPCGFTLDGRSVVSLHLDVWDLVTGRLLAGLPEWQLTRSVSPVRAGGRFAYVTEDGEFHVLRLHGLLAAPPVTTAVRLWRYAVGSGGACWDDHLTALCAHCGERFPASARVLEAIRGLTRHLSPQQSPCLELPAEAWDEPRLLAECPCCRKPLRFNPFAVDERERFQPVPEQAVRCELANAQPGRNDPCPCGSGKKYRLCCGRAPNG